MFKKPKDIRYKQFLSAMHKSRTVDWYLEIGTRFGWSAQQTAGKVILVDPYFQLSEDIIGKSPALFAFQQTSDAFFESGFLASMGIQVSLSFLDGMHLIDYVLRDFMNTEARSHPKGAIMIHDCCPYNFQMTTRDLDNLPSGAWTGDVWKIIPILRQYRPDLEITILGCKPTGLVIVRNLNPEDTKLRDHYNKILTDWRELTLENYSVVRFYDEVNYTPAQQFVADGFSFINPVLLAEATCEPKYVTP